LLHEAFAGESTDSLADGYKARSQLFSEGAVYEAISGTQFAKKYLLPDVLVGFFAERGNRHE
jgi:hypothetical protein